MNGHSFYFKFLQLNIAQSMAIEQGYSQYNSLAAELKKKTSIMLSVTVK